MAGGIQADRRQVKNSIEGGVNMGVLLLPYVIPAALLLAIYLGIMDALRR